MMCLLNKPANNAVFEINLPFDYSNYDELKENCSNILQNISDIEIVSGNAKGADSLGIRYAKEQNLELKIFPANWKKFGRAAGPIRNEEMAKYSDCLIAFWDNISKGTKSMINLAKKEGLDVHVVEFDR